MFFKRQVLVNTSPGANWVPSGTVTSVMKAAQSQYVIAVGTGVLVAGTRRGRGWDGRLRGRGLRHGIHRLGDDRLNSGYRVNGTVLRGL